MKWIFRICLSINVLLLLGSNIAGAHSFHNPDKPKKAFLKAYLTPLEEGVNTGTKFTSLAASDDLSRLTATEFEDDNAGARGGKKQTEKVNPADVFLTDWDFACNSYIIKSNLLPGKLPVALALNKIYLNIQVFRL